MALEDDARSDRPFRRSPLHATHVALGAKMVPFGGWEMPLAYPDGTVAEHRACRASAVVFDVSHLGTVRVTGPDAFDHLQYSLSNDLRKISPGRAQYTHLLDATGSVTDDIIVWWVDEERFDVMPNASNTSRVVAAIGGDDVTDERAILAVQGPGARSLLATISPEAAAVHRFAVARFTWEGTSCLVAGTGYTGEDGVECAVPAEVAESFWAAVWGPASRRPGWAPATPCASRRACRCTATSSDRASRRSRRNWDGSWAGPRGISSGVPRWKRRRPPARCAGCAAWWARGASPCVTAPRFTRPAAASAD